MSNDFANITENVAEIAKAAAYGAARSMTFTLSDFAFAGGREEALAYVAEHSRAVALGGFIPFVGAGWNALRVHGNYTKIASTNVSAEFLDVYIPVLRQAGDRMFWPNAFAAFTALGGAFNGLPLLPEQTNSYSR